MTAPVAPSKAPIFPAGAYAPSSRGLSELRRGMTGLSSLEIELLVRLDGVQRVADVRAGMPLVEDAHFAQAFHSLCDRRLVEPATTDPVAARLQIDLDRMTGAPRKGDVDAQLSSLRAAGFFVGIARSPAKFRAAAKDRPLTALVVEDEPVLGRFITSYLAFEGIQARVATNRAEVVAQLRQPPLPDVILLDVQLPDANGFDILAKLREHPVFKKVAVIMLTGQATRESVIRGIASGADGYITKPFEADALVKAVHTVLGVQQSGTVDGPWANRDCMASPAQLRA